MMEKILTAIKKIFNRFSKVIIWVVSICFIIIACMQLAVLSSVVWLNTDKGQGFIHVQLSATQNSGYKIDFSRLSYSFPQGMKIRDLNVSDADGAIMEINTVVLRPELINMLFHQFNLSIAADTVTVHRLPKGTDLEEEIAEDTDQPFGLTPFEIPDIYFSGFSLNDLSIEKLDIKEDVFGLPLQLHTKVGSRISLGDQIDFDLNLKVRDGGLPVPPWMPKNISMAGQLNSKTLQARLDNLDIESAAYVAKAKGDAVLSENGTLNLEADLKVDDFSVLAEGIDGNAAMTLALTGSINQPAIQSNGKISSSLLNQRGLKDIEFSIIDDNIRDLPLGSAVIKTAYQDKPVELSAEFDVDEAAYKVVNINGSASGLSLEGNIDISKDTTLASGTITADVQSLDSYSALFEIPLKGKLKADVTLSANDNKQAVSIDTTLNNIAYRDITLDEANLKVMIADVTYPWPNSLDAKVKNLRLTTDVLIRNATANIAANENDSYGITLNADGRALQDFKIKGQARVQDIKEKAIKADDIDVTLSSAGSALMATGWADKNALDIKFNTKGFQLGSIPADLPDQLEKVSMDANVSIAGAMNDPTIELDAVLSPISVVKETQINLSIDGQYQHNNVRVNVIGEGDSIDDFNANAQLPLSLSLYPFQFDMAQDAALSGAVNVKAKAVSIVKLFLPVGHTVQGYMNVDGQIAGTVGSPDITAKASLSDAYYRMDAYGVELYDMSMQAVMNMRTASLEMQATDGTSGTMKADGSVVYDNPAATKIYITLNDFHLLESDKADGTLSADLNFEGRENDSLLSGEITLGQFDIAIPERFQSNIPTLNIVEKGEEVKKGEELKAILLDIGIAANDRIFVRGWGLDAEFGGNIDVTGSLADPQLNGELDARRGRYEEFGKRFDLDKAYLRFQGSVPPSPYLDISATTNTGDIEAIVNFSGEIDNPSIKLSSVPALPEDEVMSQILFGRNLEKVTPFQAIQLKQTLDRFSGRGGGGFDPLGKLREITGFDDIVVNQDADGDTSVGAGKYLTEDVYLELEKGAGEDSGTAKVQIELTPSVSLESEIGQDAQAGAGAIWKWDY